MSADILPDYFEESGFKTFRDYDSLESEHIDPFAGGLILQNTDLVVPGNGGMDIVVKRFYRSLAGDPSVEPVGDYNGELHTVLGIGWDLHFGRVWFEDGYNIPVSTNYIAANGVAGTRNPVLELTDGTRKILFDETNGNGYITKDRWRGITDGNGGIEVFSPAGIKYTFDYKSSTNDNAWHVTRIEDIAGNYLKVEYNTSNSNLAVITKVTGGNGTSSDGRSVTFTYDNQNDYNARLKQVKLNNVTKATYTQTVLNSSAFPREYFLDKVVRAEAGNWLYYYDKRRGTSSSHLDPGLHSMDKMVNPHGVTTEYTYGQEQFSTAPFIENSIITSKTVSGPNVTGGTWDYTFSPRGTSSSRDYDITKVISPNYCTEYHHFATLAATNNLVWKVGSLLEKKFYDNANCSSGLLKTETYDWGTITTTDQNEFNRRTSSVDTDAQQPVMLSQTTRLYSGATATSYKTEYSLHDNYGNPERKEETFGTGSVDRKTDYVYLNIDNISNDAYVIGLTEKETIRAGSGSTIISNTDTAYYETISQTYRLGKVKSINQNGITISRNYHTATSRRGELSTETGPRGFTSSYTSYKRGVPRTETHPESVSISRNVNDQGTIQNETNGRGKTTSYSYDGLNRLTAITTPKTTDANTSISWSDGGRVRTVTRGSFSSVVSEDGLGRVISREAEGIALDFQYNAEGYLTRESNPRLTSASPVWKSTTRDALGRPKVITLADGTVDSATISYSYLSNNRVQVTDERGKVTTYTYESYGDPDERYLVQIDAPESSTTVITRDLIGNITQVSQGGNNRTYTLDSRKFIDTINNPETGITDVNYDNAGNLTSRRVGISSTTTMQYDDLDRLATTNYPAGTEDVTRLYDKNNNPTSIANTGSSWAYQYDDNDNLTTETLTLDVDGVNKNYVFSYGYDVRDNLSSITYPISGQTVSFSPDDLGRATQVSGYINTAISYHPDFSAKDYTYANGEQTTIGIDNRLRPDQIQSVGAGSPDAGLDIQYNYDPASNIQTITDNAIPADSRSLIYDDLNRLTNVSDATSSWDRVINYSTDDDITSKVLNGATCSGQVFLATVL